MLYQALYNAYQALNVCASITSKGVYRCLQNFFIEIAQKSDIIGYIKNSSRSPILCLFFI